LFKKQFFGIFFTFLYVAALLRPFLPLMIYYANYDYIANELCVNKDKPYLECYGNCYLEALEARLNPIKEKQKPVSPRVNLMDYPITTLYVCRYKISPPLKLLLNLPETNKHFILQEYQGDIFHPPKYNS